VIELGQNNTTKTNNGELLCSLFFVGRQQQLAIPVKSRDKSFNARVPLVQAGMFV